MTDATVASPIASAQPAVRVLMRGVIDYAGLFPPASLSMTDALTEYAEHRNGIDAWVLGRLVLHAARLDEFAEVARPILPREGARSWAVSALLGSDLEEDVARIERFNDEHRDARDGAVQVDTVELKGHNIHDVAHAGELLDRRFDTYIEIPVVDDPDDLVRAISATKAKAKIRTGGMTADSFPASSLIARFISRCLERGVAFKATAGLHHAWRSDYRLTYAADAPRAPMFGFLNVILSVALLAAGEDIRSAMAMLEEHDPSSVRFGEREVTWRGRTLPLETLAEARSSLTAFGSCSFREPIAELRAQRLL